MERQHELEFQRSKAEAIQAQAKLFKDYPGLDGFLTMEGAIGVLKGRRRRSYFSSPVVPEHNQG